ncbi:hypothetical protein EXD76_08290, partial [BEV proteobacterium]|nr:hypothetical protein [Candidatus Symbiopectobacterium sp. Chty_BC]
MQQSLIWVTLSLAFNAGLWWYLKGTLGVEIANTQAPHLPHRLSDRKALAVDNVFVWLMLFSYFSVPAQYQRRVMVYGVLRAIILRMLMVFGGSWLVTQFQWLLYVFGAFLLFTGLKMAF